MTSSSVEAFSPSMQYMDAPVRDKAFDIFNALLDEGYDDDQAIPIAIAQAKKWAQANRHGQNSGTQCVHVVPHPDGWAIRRADSPKSNFVFKRMGDAKTKALEIGKREQVGVVLHDQYGEVHQHIHPVGGR
jgi:uncharacterized protein DUF2188